MKDDSSTRRLLLKDTRGGAFTLVEMLTVLTIILILMGIGVPAIRGLLQSENRRAAIGTLMAAMDRARMMAIADGQATYVVFLAQNKTPDGDGANINPSLFGRGYAIYQDSDNVNFVPVQRSSWMYLPSSVAFKVAGNLTASVTNRLDGGTSSTDPAFVLPRALLTTSPSGQGTHLPYLKFDSTGTADLQTAQLLRIFLFPGTVSLTGTESYTQQGADTSTGKLLLEEVDVNVATGRAKYVVNPYDNLTYNSAIQ